MSEIADGMASEVEQDHADFIAEIADTDGLLSTTFVQGSPAFNVERALNHIVEEIAAKQDEYFHVHTYCQTAQVIRMILKAWQKYGVNLGEEYMPGEVLDNMILGYSVMQTIGDDRNNHESLAYKVAHCFTAEMKVHAQRKDFTQNKLDGIIEGAAKAYLTFMAIAVSGEGDATSLERDPEPTLATFTRAPLPPSPDVEGNKRKAPLSNSDDEQNNSADSTKPKKKTKKSRADQVKDLQQAMQAALRDTKCNPKLLGMESDGFEIIDETPALGAHVNAGPYVDVARGSGNFGHGRAIKWTEDEDKSARDRLRENPQLTFAKLTEMHNEEWEGTALDNGKNGAVTRGKRTKEAIQARFKTFRQQLGGGKAAKSPMKSTQKAAEFDKGVTGLESAGGRPELNSDWLGVLYGEKRTDKGVESESELVELEEEDDDDDAVADLEELACRVEEGEAFADE